MDLKELTDEELVQLEEAVDAEKVRRSVISTVPASMAYLNLQYLRSEGVEEGAPWRQPTGAHDAFPKDWVTSHKDKTWISLMDTNVWEPGVSGWVELVPEGELPAWVQPTGAHDAYGADAEVQHVSRQWKSLVDDNVWEPGAPGSETLWEDLGPWPPEESP